jgi:D-serine deaminase-like pyridoxal phosphate-dependent protein
VPAQVVIDAGSKTLTSDLCGPAPQSGYGYVVEYPQAKITRLSEEHGQVDISACASPPDLGERLTIIPNHICVCVNMQSSIWWREPEGATRELRVEAAQRQWVAQVGDGDRSARSTIIRLKLSEGQSI